MIGLSCDGGDAGSSGLLLRSGFHFHFPVFVLNGFIQQDMILYNVIQVLYRGLYIYVRH